tara:strand:+ start:883 stop:1542 length:660 start_codon:yes stop_codon:yes gene_type:complete
MRPNRLLIVQTAFIGDVVLAMPLIAQLRLFFPKIAIDFLVRKGNESLLAQDARIQNILIWDKKEKIKNLIKLIREVKKVYFEIIIYVQRVYSMCWLTLLANAKVNIGFDKNPSTWDFEPIIARSLADQVHKVDRIPELWKPLGSLAKWKSGLQMRKATFAFIEAIESQITVYITGRPEEIKLGNEIQQQTPCGRSKLMWDLKFASIGCADRSCYDELYE